MSEIEIKLPNIGDFKDVEVIEVLVVEGQTIKKNEGYNESCGLWLKGLQLTVFE